MNNKEGGSSEAEETAKGLGATSYSGIALRNFLTTVYLCSILAGADTVC